MAKVHHSSPHRRAAGRLKAQRHPWCQCTTGCIYPGQPIRYDLAAPHPLSFSAEHVIAVSSGGSTGPLAPAHLGCQRRQGGLIRAGKVMRRRWTSGTW